MRFGNWIAAMLVTVISWPLEPVMADEVAGLYETEVPVLGQKRDERRAAIEAAFVEVLVRVSGRTAVANVPSLEDVLKRASRYVQQYRYRKVDPGLMPGTENEQYDQVLWIRFDEQAVNGLLREHGLPVWSKTRPATLVWVVIDDGGKRQIISNDSTHELRNLSLSLAKNRGVPLRLPLFDLQDRSALRVSDVWGNFGGAILEASQRYQTEAVLSGRVYQGFGGTWHGRWSLYSGGRRDDQEFRGTSLSEVVQPAINEVAEALSVRFAEVRQDTESNRVSVLIKDVRSLADFNRVSTYLGGLSGVEAVQPYFINSDRVTFDLLARNGRLGVSQAISLGHVLVNDTAESEGVEDTPQPKPETSPARTTSPPLVSPDLVYRLIP